MNFIEELKWRGMLHDCMPDTEEFLQRQKVAGYAGFDPTSDSLHVGSLVPIMLLVHLQRAGHQPIALVGGATGMVGDPSGKSEERNLMDEAQLKRNQEGVRKQLEQFLDFDAQDNPALLVNNYDWMSKFSFLDFIRKVGKHVTVNYMLAKDSVKNRIESGISFTEFSYQLLQAYDFLHLFENYNCTLQIGGSDQWGNITTGTELIRRMAGGKAYAATCPLITKADGGKFGKSEEGNVWLDRNKTSPYKFYQFWINCSDEDASKYIRIFTLLDQPQIVQIEKEHAEAPHLRNLQKALAEDVTRRVHSQQDLDAAIAASKILFGKSTADDLKGLSKQQILEVFEGVPHFKIARSTIDEKIDAIDFLADGTGIFPSKGEAKRALKENAVSVNKQKIALNHSISAEALLSDSLILVQKGKKNYFLVEVI